MPLILTSDFPDTAPPEVLSRMRAVAEQPRIAWIPSTSEVGATFARARDRFAGLGFHAVEPCDIDRAADPVQLAYLYEFDIIYLGGPDAVLFRYNVLRTGLFGRLRQSAAAGRLIVAAGGGSLLLTPNVSAWRLHNETVNDVIDTRGRFEAAGAVGFEVLPHMNGWDTALRDRVTRYSSLVEHEVVGIADGAALFPTDQHTFDYTGQIARFRRGQPATG